MRASATECGGEEVLQASRDSQEGRTGEKELKKERNCFLCVMSDIGW